MKILGVTLAAIGGLICFGVANAQSTNTADKPSSASIDMPKAGFFVGFGGSYNVINTVNQNNYTAGVSNVIQGGTQVAAGQAGGSADLHMDADQRFAPVVQAGYFQHFPDSEWIWGARFSYSYLNSTSTKQNLFIPQAGAFAGSVPASTFTGNVYVRSYEVSVNHQFLLTPFIGHTFERSYAYAGAGPSLSQTQTLMRGTIGFADINGTHANITGTPADYSAQQWTLGGAAVAGISYFLDRSWFLDVGYAFSMTATPAASFAGPFVGTTGTTTSVGVLSGNFSGSVITNTIRVSINRSF
jgi:hypothetical protein